MFIDNGDNNSEKETQDLLKYGYPLYLPFRFELYQKVMRSKKHRDLLACGVVCNL